MRSTTVGRKEGSTWGRPIPSIREPVSTRTDQSSASHAGKKAECSGSTTQMRVG